MWLADAWAVITGGDHDAATALIIDDLKHDFAGGGMLDDIMRDFRDRSRQRLYRFLRPTFALGQVASVLARHYYIRFVANRHPNLVLIQVASLSLIAPTA